MIHKDTGSIRVHHILPIRFCRRSTRINVVSIRFAIAPTSLNVAQKGMEKNIHQQTNHFEFDCRQSWVHRSPKRQNHRDKTLREKRQRIRILLKRENRKLKSLVHVIGRVIRWRDRNNISIWSIFRVKLRMIACTTIRTFRGTMEAATC
jgi:hypothetical protein